MPGGLLNLVAYGNQNVILNGNPSKTFFKTTYAKYTNFGLQKFRIDFSGQRTLRLTESSVFDFTVPRYGDLLMDTYLVVNLPKGENLGSIDLVLEAGAANGSYQIGCLLYLKELENQKKVKIDRISGSSIGAISGFYYFTDM